MKFIEKKSADIQKFVFKNTFMCENNFSGSWLERTLDYSALFTGLVPYNYITYGNVVRSLFYFNSSLFANQNRVDIFANQYSRDVIGRFASRLSELVGTNANKGFFVISKESDEFVSAISAKKNDMDLLLEYNAINELDISRYVLQELNDTNFSAGMLSFCRNFFLGQGLIIKGKKGGRTTFTSLPYGEYNYYTDPANDLELIMVPILNKTETLTELGSDGSPSKKSVLNKTQVYVNQGDSYRLIVYDADTDSIIKDTMLKEKHAFFCKHSDDHGMGTSTSFAGDVYETVITVSKIMEVLGVTAVSKQVPAYVVDRNRLAEWTFGFESPLDTANNTSRDRGAGSRFYIGGSGTRGGSSKPLEIKMSPNIAGMSTLLVKNGSPETAVRKLEKEQMAEEVPFVLQLFKKLVDSLIGLEPQEETTATDSLAGKRTALSVLAPFVLEIRRKVVRPILESMIRDIGKKYKFWTKKEITESLAQGILFNTDVEFESTTKRVEDLAKLIQFNQETFGEQALSAIDPVKLGQTLTNILGLDGSIMSKEGLDVIKETSAEYSKKVHLQNQQADVSVKQADASSKMQGSGVQPSQG